MLGRDVVHLGEVVVEAEQRPGVPLEVVTARDQLAFDGELRADVVGHRLPTVDVDRARAQHLEVLPIAR
jgi:hypothetical protein